MTNPWSRDGDPDLLSDNAQKGNCDRRDAVAAFPCMLLMSRDAGTELILSLSGAKIRVVAGSCRLAVGDHHDGVAEGLLSGERLCRMKSGRRDLAGV